MTPPPPPGGDGHGGGGVTSLVRATPPIAQVSIKMVDCKVKLRFTQITPGMSRGALASPTSWLNFDAELAFYTVRGGRSIMKLGTLVMEWLREELSLHNSCSVVKELHVNMDGYFLTWSGRDSANGKLESEMSL